MNSFNQAQTFYIDPGVVANSPQVALTAVDLFFQAKPARTGNQSGINNPGVTIFIADTTYGTPFIDNTAYVMARCEYDQIATTSDASLATKFRFNSVVTVKTGKEYAIIIMFDGSEQFQLWSSTVGDFLIDKKTISPGPSGKYIGKYYDYTNTSSNFGAGGEVSSAVSSSTYQSQWTPLNDIDLKFKVYCARYSHNGYAVSSNTSIPGNTQIIHSPVIKDQTVPNEVYLYPSSCIEMITFNQANSVKEKFVGGQWAYQNTPAYPGGFANSSSSIKVSVSGNDRVVANSAYPNGQSFSWRDIYPTVGLTTTGNDAPWIVLKNGNEVDIRGVVAVVSNTILQVDEPVTFVNSAAEFLITPVGQIDSFNKASPFGNFDSIVILTNSSANSTLRFVNNAVESISVIAGGSGYSNSNVLYIKGYENVANKVIGGYQAVANIVTNGSGTIQQVYFSNLGCGFVYSNTSFVITSSANATATANTSAGNGAAFSTIIGSTIKTEDRNNVFAKTRVANFALSDVTPFFDIDHPAGTSYDIKMKCNYYLQNEPAVYSNMAYYVSATPEEMTIPINMFVRNAFVGSKVPAFVSRSNEFITPYANGAPNNTTKPGTTSNVMTMVVNTTSNSDFLCITVNSIPSLSLSTYIVNNDWSNEHTDQGNAWARQITTKINYARPAEDLLVYLTAYKPPGTDIKLYARMYNSTDSEYFEDKEWTYMHPNYTSNLVSSATNTNDWIELAYNLFPFHTPDFVSNGTASAVLANNVLTGAGTAFNTNFVTGDLVKVSNPIFANNYFIDVVSTVVNATSIVLNNPISNVNFATTGMKVERIRKYKHQAFNNTLNSNVARYYNSTMVPFDGYDVVQIKAVMLADRPNLIPRIDDIRALGVSA